MPDLAGKDEPPWLDSDGSRDSFAADRGCDARITLANDCFAEPKLAVAAGSRLVRGVSLTGLRISGPRPSTSQSVVERFLHPLIELGPLTEKRFGLARELRLRFVVVSPCNLARHRKGGDHAA